MDSVIRIVETFCSGMADRLSAGHRLEVLGIVSLVAWCLFWPMLLAVGADSEPELIGPGQLVRFSILYGLVMTAPSPFVLWCSPRVRSWPELAVIIFLLMLAVANAGVGLLLLSVADLFQLGGWLLALAAGGLPVWFYVGLRRQPSQEPEPAVRSEQF